MHNRVSESFYPSWDRYATDRPLSTFRGICDLNQWSNDQCCGTWTNDQFVINDVGFQPMINDVGFQPMISDVGFQPVIKWLVLWDLNRWSTDEWCRISTSDQSSGTSTNDQLSGILTNDQWSGISTNDQMIWIWSCDQMINEVGFQPVVNYVWFELVIKWSVKWDLNQWSMMWNFNLWLYDQWCGITTTLHGELWQPHCDHTLLLWLCLVHISCIHMCNYFTFMLVVLVFMLLCQVWHNLRGYRVTLYPITVDILVPSYIGNDVANFITSLKHILISYLLIREIMYVMWIHLANASITYISWLFPFHVFIFDSFICNMSLLQGNILSF